MRPSAGHSVESRHAWVKNLAGQRQLCAGRGYSLCPDCSSDGDFLRDPPREVSAEQHRKSSGWLKYDGSRSSLFRNIVKGCRSLFPVLSQPPDSRANSDQNS